MVLDLLGKNFVQRIKVVFISYKENITNIFSGKIWIIIEKKIPRQNIISRNLTFRKSYDTKEHS